MNLSWRDAWTTLLAIAGGGVVFAKTQEYSWWLIGSWKGALGVLAAIGFLMLAVNVSELTDWHNWVNWSEAVLWIAAATVMAIGLFTAAQAMFYTAASLLGVTWLAVLIRHAFHTTHQHPTYASY